MATKIRTSDIINLMPEQVQQPTPQSQGATTPKSTNWKKIILTVLIISVVTGVIIGAYWFFVLNKSSDVSDLTGPVPKPQVSTSTPSAKKDETAGWKVFKSAKVTYEFKYPPSFGLSEKEKSITIKPSEYSETSIESCGPQVLTKGWRMSVTYDDSFVGEKITLKQLTNYEFAFTSKDFEKVEKYETTLDGQEAMRLTYKGPLKISDCYLSPTESMERILTVNKDGLYFAIEARYLNKDKESVINIFNQILSTFKFLD